MATAIISAGSAEPVKPTDAPPAAPSAEDLARQFVTREQAEPRSEDRKRRWLQERLQKFIDLVVEEKILRDQAAVRQRDAMIEYDRHRMRADKLQLVVNRMRRKLQEA